MITKSRRSISLVFTIDKYKFTIRNNVNKNLQNMYYSDRLTDFWKIWKFNYQSAAFLETAE